jgi:hypothetical protein
MKKTSIKSEKRYKIIFEKLQKASKEQDVQIKEDIQTSQEVSDTINLLRQFIDNPEDSQITITRS